MGRFGTQVRADIAYLDESIETIPGHQNVSVCVNWVGGIAR